MKDNEIIKLIKSKAQAIEENLLLTNELRDIKKSIENFLDINLKGDSILCLKYRRFRMSSNLRTLWSSTDNFPKGGYNWIKPYFDFFEQYITEKTIINRLENENIWVETRTQGNEQHILAGKRKSDGKKVHIILGDTGEIRIDKKDQQPNEIYKKVESILTKNDGSKVKSTLEFLNAIE